MSAEPYTIDYTTAKTEAESIESIFKLLKYLEIPCEIDQWGNPIVRGQKLLPMLMDDKQCRALISKLRNKAFW
jgi:hypothetical protein